MAGPQIGGFADAMLEPGMQIRFEAIDPTTGLTVSGVTVSNVGILAEGTAVGTGTFEAGPFMLVPGPGA